MNKQQQTLFVISHVTISASEPDANGFTDTRLFKTKKRLSNNSKSGETKNWNAVKTSGATYVVYADTDKKFHCIWDADNEGVIITLKEVEVA